MGPVLRLLLVDDDVVDRGAVKRALHAAGVRCEVTEFELAQAAFDAVREAPDAFDCALFDLRLPDRDGLDLLKGIRSLGADLPVIFLTGQGSEEVAVDLMRSGASDYLPKGQLSPARLQQSIGHALRLMRTERAQREAEGALRESEANFRRLAENLPDAVVRFDRAGRHIYVNQPVPWSRLSTVDELLGRTLVEAGCDPAVVAPLEAALERALAGSADQVTMYLPELRPAQEASGGDGEDQDGELIDEVPRWVEVRFVPERTRDDDASESVTSVLGISRDVTARVLRRQEEERRSEFERQLIGIVSHDLRNPIGAILMSTSLLKRSVDGDERLVRALDLLQRSGQRAQRMVSDILDFTKARLGGGIPLAPRQCDLAEAVGEVVNETRTTHPGRVIELIVDGPGRGLFDPDRIAQATSNLVLNAITYSPPDEAVTVRVEELPSEVAIAVTNRGEAIAPEVLPLLFKPFQRGLSRVSDKDATRSVGLGLFIVEQIVQGHRGRIEVSSEGGLTCFRVLLPRRPPSGRLRALTPPGLPALA
ncbi:MAG: response regulator [Myxococcota bacterium]